ncbi:MAG: hypothetical protein WA734_08545 [Candidatus Acidiferrales bacterium]
MAYRFGLTYLLTQRYCCVGMIPDFDVDGNLPPGRHRGGWKEFEKRFGTSFRRQRLLAGMKRMLLSLKDAGCGRVFMDGSFVSAKANPRDYDGCWDRAGMDLSKLLKRDPVLLDFANKRLAQKFKYGGEMFPADLVEAISGTVFLEFFERDKDSGEQKGVVEIDLGELS